LHPSLFAHRFAVTIAGGQKEARRLVAAGEDPSAAKRQHTAALQLRQTGSFDVVADEYIERLRLKGRSESTIGKNV